MILSASAVAASDFVDTRVTFVVSDENVLAGPEERSPEAGFQASDDEMFFENLDQEKRGLETETELVLYKRAPSYFDHLDAEAALVIELENWVNERTWENETRIGDDGSYLKLNVYICPDCYEGDNLSITLFPFDSQRFLLGYTYDIAWGGERIFPNNTGQVPGAKLRWDFATETEYAGYAFVGAKTARLLNEEIHERETYYGVLGGAGVNIGPYVAWEVNGGYFQRGAFPPQGQGTEIGGVTVEAFGGSTRLTVHDGMPIQSSVDFRLYRNAPDAADIITAEQLYDDGVAWSAAAEFTCVGQNLLSWDEPDTTVIEPAMAGALVAKLRVSRLRLHADGIYRDLSFVLFDIPGLAPFHAFPEEGEVSPEWFVAAGFDYHFDSTRLTPGLIVGYKHPASFTSGDVTTVFREIDDWETLPPGERAFDIVSAKASLRWDIAEFFTTAAEIRYSLDNNRTKYAEGEDEESGKERVFEDTNVTNRLGFSVLAQARF